MTSLIARINNIIATTVVLIIYSHTCSADNLDKLKDLKKTYPAFIKEVSGNSIIWTDGEQTNIERGAKYQSNSKNSESPSLQEQLNQPKYPSNKIIKCSTYIPNSDTGRIRNEKFFSKMYGHTEDSVRNNLVTIYWMPQYFGHKYPLLISKANGVSTKLKNASDQLELLVKKHPEFIKYLENPSGTFYWRHIKNSGRRSPHSFGIAIDINSNYANYWIWDTGIKENKINQSDSFPYKNRVPCQIVTVFENNGFIWGGKWQHYDTMHFEFRSELLQ